MGIRSRPRIHVSAVVALVMSLVLAPASVLATHQSGWSHDHSSSGLPFRPSGYSQLVKRFGQPCSGAANDARSYFPSAAQRGSWGYVNYHPYLARNVGHNILGHLGNDHRYGAVDYGVYGYTCRRMRGSSNWSTHAFGAAIDSNTARNPQGQSSWNGVGANGVNYGRYIPNLWKLADPGHRFVWGLSWNDPHHFQYVSGY